MHRTRARTHDYRTTADGRRATAQRTGPMSDAAWVIFIRYMTRDLPADVNTNHPAKGTMMSPTVVKVIEDRRWLSNAKYYVAYRSGEEAIWCWYVHSHIGPIKNIFRFSRLTYVEIFRNNFLYFFFKIKIGFYFDLIFKINSVYLWPVSFLK